MPADQIKRSDMKRANMDRLAQRVADDDVSVQVAAKRIGIGKSYAYRLWDEIKRALGAQAV